MIRCKKCGYSNKDFAERCVKCRTILSEEENPGQADSGFNRRTIQVSGEEQEPWDQPVLPSASKSFLESKHQEPVRPEYRPSEPEEREARPEQYGLPPEEDIPLVAEILKKENTSGQAQPNGQVGSGSPTVRRFVPQRLNGHYLVALSPDEEKELRKIELAEQEVILDRAILDPSNSSISRNGHAQLYMKNGDWYLENKSAFQTTFVRVNQPVKLSDGDVILIGDSLFKFKKSGTGNIEN